ncbi:hypothetical protein Gotri_005768, partial [Gossypium trilobum]|nr:hypothetical protein [Gossypium trilobum]
ARFHDLHLFNIALLVRQVWRLLNHRDTLCYQVMSSKYFPNGDLFHPKANINIRRDNWGLKGLNGDTLNPTIPNVHESKVSDLWSVDQQSWNKERVKELYESYMGDQICNFPLNGNGSNDRMECPNARSILMTGGLDNKLLIKETGYRMVIRDGDGFVISGGGGFKSEELIRQWAEIYAFVESVKLARTMNISKALFETDYTYLANRVNKCDSDIIIMGTRIKEIFNSMDMFGSVSICWTSRNCNKVANFICKDAIKDSCNQTFVMDYLENIYALTLVCPEAVNSPVKDKERSNTIGPDSVIDYWWVLPPLIVGN